VNSFNKTNHVEKMLLKLLKRYKNVVTYAVVNLLCSAFVGVGICASSLYAFRSCVYVGGGGAGRSGRAV
jgi:hypothetical protein